MIKSFIHKGLEIFSTDDGCYKTSSYLDFFPNQLIVNLDKNA